MTRRKLILAFALLPALCFAADTPRGIHEFQQVNEHIYRGGQPSRAGIQSLATIGVRAVVDLRGGGERSLAEKKHVEALGMQYYSIPLPGLKAPQKEQISAILGLLNDPHNWPVFVHCQHGRDRTGTVVACYRISRENWTNRRALNEAIDNGLSRFETGMRAFIRQYEPAGETPKAVALAQSKSIQ
jgi:protein tyrosine/serine phosphatase